MLQRALRRPSVEAKFDGEHTAGTLPGDVAASAQQKLRSVTELLAGPRRAQRSVLECSDCVTWREVLVLV